ncbi:MAG: LptF/LptG family permease [Coraliomargaritaceae bacterium]
MLKLLHRHLFKEIFIATLLAMMLFVFVLIAGNALRDIVGLLAAGKLDAFTFFRLIGLLIPYVAAYALPLAILTGTLVALGRLSSQREIIAMKSAGWSLYQVAAPVACIAFVGMIGSILVNLHYAPRSKVAARDLLTRVVTDNPLGFIEEKRFINEFPGYVIYMGAKEGDQLEDFWVWELDVDRKVKRFVRAATGQLGFNEESSELILRVFNATAEIRDASNLEDFGSGQMQTVFFEQTDFSLPLDKVIGDRSKRNLKISNMDFSQLMALRSKALAAELSENTSVISKERMRAQTQIQKNCAMAFSTFSLALFGVPLAIQAGRKETYANLAMALVVAMTYYFLMVVVTWLEDNPALRPDLLVWLPNLLFQTAALFLIVRAARH